MPMWQPQGSSGMAASPQGTWVALTSPVPVVPMSLTGSFRCTARVDAGPCCFLRDSSEDAGQVSFCCWTWGQEQDCDSEPCCSHLAVQGLLCSEPRGPVVGLQLEMCAAFVTVSADKLEAHQLINREDQEPPWGVSLVLQGH